MGSSFTSAVKSGSRMRILRAQRRRLAEELDMLTLGSNPSGVATLSRQLIAVCREIDSLSGQEPGAGQVGQVSRVDELAAIRRARRAGAAPEGRVRRRGPG